MKLLFVSHTDHSYPTITGGAIRYVNLFPLWEKQSDIQITILDNSQLLSGEFYRRLSLSYQSIDTITFPYPYFLPYKLRLLYHLITAIIMGLFRSRNVDVIFSDFTPLQLIPAYLISVLNRKKLVVTVQLFDHTSRSLQYKVLKFMLGRAQLILCCNPYYLNFISHPNIAITQYALGSGFRPLPHVSKEYDLCFIGTVENNRKGIREYVRTAEKLYNNHLINKTLIITQSTAFDYFDSLHPNPQLFVIKHNLSQEQVNLHLNQSKIFVFPTQAESFGLVIGEALKAGILVVISNIPELKVWHNIVYRTDNYYHTTQKLLENYQTVKKTLKYRLSRNKLLKQTWSDIAKIEANYMFNLSHHN